MRNHQRRYGGRGRQADTVSRSVGVPPLQHRNRNWFGKSPRNSNGSDPSCSQTPPTPSQRRRFLRPPKRSSSFSPRCLFARDFVLRVRAARALGTRSLRRLKTSTFLLSTITATQTQRAKPTKSMYTWGKAGTLRTWSSTNGGRDRGVVQSPYPVLLATYPPFPALTLSLPRHCHAHLFVCSALASKSHLCSSSVHAAAAT